MIREMVKIDEDKCDGCGLCVPNCHEGALQIIDGKARLISDLMCDGLGACIGHCPQDAITVEKREAEPYDEVKVLSENILKAGENVLKAHLLHLKEHNQEGYLKEAIDYLNREGIEVPKFEKVDIHHGGGGCPGSQQRSFKREDSGSEMVSSQSQLAQWPVQFHLINPMAPYFKNSDLLIAADCTAFSVGDFHQKWLKNRTVAIGCPKLDSDMDRYVEKVVRLIDESRVNTITVMVMEVPCCNGMLGIVNEAVKRAERKVPVKKVVVSLQGEILVEDWI